MSLIENAFSSLCLTGEAEAYIIVQRIALRNLDPKAVGIVYANRR